MGELVSPYLGLISRRIEMIRECESCSMRLAGGYLVHKEYLCRACYERLSSKEFRDSWLLKTEGAVIEMVSRNKVKVRKR